MINQPIINFTSKKHKSNRLEKRNKKQGLSKDGNVAKVSLVQPKITPKTEVVETISKPNIQPVIENGIDDIKEDITYDKDFQTNTKRNMILGSLMALATLSLPTAYIVNENMNEPRYYSYSTDANNGTTEDAPIYQKEFSNESMEEYQRDYISGDELVDCLDYSEISRYQKDVSVLRALLRGGFGRIKRDDPQRSEKFANEIEKAQSTINHIVENYKNNSKIAGNDNYDNIVTSQEIINLLELGSIKDLSKEEQTKILENAKKSCREIFFNDIHDKDDIKSINQRVFKEIQKAQNMVDAQVYKALCAKYGISENNVK